MGFSDGFLGICDSTVLPMAHNVSGTHEPAEGGLGGGPYGPKPWVRPPVFGMCMLT